MRLWSVAAILGAAGLAVVPRAQADDTFEYVELSFTGDGRTPSALSLYDAQERGPKSVDFGADASDKGDVSSARCSLL